MLLHQLHNQRLTCRHLSEPVSFKWQNCGHASFALELIVTFDTLSGSVAALKICAHVARISKPRVEDNLASLQLFNKAAD